MPEEIIDSAFQRRATIAELVENGVTDGAVLSQLISDGHAISDEAVLWDFKLEVPVLPVGIKLSDATKRSYDAKFAEIVKDCVALYNTYGGYLVVGVDNGDVPFFVEHCEAAVAEVDVTRRLLDQQGRRELIFSFDVLAERHGVPEVACVPSIVGSLLRLPAWLPRSSAGPSRPIAIASRCGRRDARCS